MGAVEISSVRLRLALELDDYDYGVRTPCESDTSAQEDVLLIGVVVRRFSENVISDDCKPQLSGQSEEMGENCDDCARVAVVDLESVVSEQQAYVCRQHGTRQMNDQLTKLLSVKWSEN